MIKLKDILTEEFKPTVVLAKYSGGGNYKPFKQVHFKSKDEANKFIKDMMKKYKLKRQKGFWGNPQTGIELVTNFQETMMINMKDLIKKQNDEIRKETGMIKEEKIPADIKMFMDKFIGKLQGKTLNRNKTKAILTTILKALGIDAKELSAYVTRVKKEL